MIIKFDKEIIEHNEIDINDIGNFVMEALDENGYAYYVVVRTYLGDTEFITCGPVDLDIPELVSPCSINYQKFQFNANKIETLTDKLLNGKNKILYANIKTLDECIDNFLDIKGYLTRS